MKKIRFEVAVVIAAFAVCFITIGCEAASRIPEKKIKEQQGNYVKMYTDVIVRGGDTVTSIYQDICKKHPDTMEGYNTKLFVEEVQFINEFSHPDINKIRPGDRLVVPYLNGQKE